MKTKNKILVAGISLILFVLPGIAQNIGLDDRLCYNNEVVPGRFIFSCFYSDTGIYEKNFFDYPAMHDFYTPQLKESVWTIGNQVVNQKNTIQVGTMSVTGSPSYIYSKGGN